MACGKKEISKYKSQRGYGEKKLVTNIIVLVSAATH